MPQPVSSIRFKRLAEIQQRIDSDRRSLMQDAPPPPADPKMLGDLLQAFIVERGLNRMLSANVIENTVFQILGPQKSSMVRVGQLRRGILNITVSNSCLLGELRSFQKPAIMKALRESGAASGLTDIRFRVSQITDSNQPSDYETQR